MEDIFVGEEEKLQDPEFGKDILDMSGMVVRARVIGLYPEMFRDVNTVMGPGAVLVPGTGARAMEEGGSDAAVNEAVLQNRATTLTRKLFGKFGTGHTAGQSKGSRVRDGSVVSIMVRYRGHARDAMISVDGEPSVHFRLPPLTLPHLAVVMNQPGTAVEVLPPHARVTRQLLLPDGIQGRTSSVRQFVKSFETLQPPDLAFLAPFLPMVSAQQLERFVR